MLLRFEQKKTSPEALRSDAVRIISKLCKGHAENQDLFRRHVGIAALVRELEEYITHHRIAIGNPQPMKAGGAVPEEDEEEEHAQMGGSAKNQISPLVIATVDCIWNAAAGNKRSEARLLEDKGIDSLLDLLEICPTLMRNQVVGLIAELACNPRCLPYLTAWRSARTMMGCVQLLMRIWEEEEIRLKVPRADGVVTNLWKPLGRHSAAEGVVPKSAPTNFFHDIVESKEGAIAGSSVFKKLDNALDAGQKQTGKSSSSKHATGSTSGSAGGSAAASHNFEWKKLCH
jgi:hypothetical protein